MVTVPSRIGWTNGWRRLSLATRFACASGVVLVLAANLFADGVRDAFDPRSRAFRPRLGLRKATP